MRGVLEPEGGHGANGEVACRRDDPLAGPAPQDFEPSPVEAPPTMDDDGTSPSDSDGVPLILLDAEAPDVAGPEEDELARWVQPFDAPPGTVSGPRKVTYLRALFRFTKRSPWLALFLVPPALLGAWLFLGPRRVEKATRSTTPASLRSIGLQRDREHPPAPAREDQSAPAPASEPGPDANRSVPVPTSGRTGEKQELPDTLAAPNIQGEGPVIAKEPPLPEDLASRRTEEMSTALLTADAELQNSEHEEPQMEQGAERVEGLGAAEKCPPTEGLGAAGAREMVLQSGTADPEPQDGSRERLPEGQDEDGRPGIPDVRGNCLASSRHANLNNDGGAYTPASETDCGSYPGSHLFGSAAHAHRLCEDPSVEFYQDFSEPGDLSCFRCHGQGLVLDERTTTSTRFRNGDRNLHHLHVHRKKGRSCGVCHDIHAPDLPSQVRESVLFGPSEWELPIGFRKSANGGMCGPGCHRAKSYRRTQNRQGVDAAAGGAVAAPGSR